MDKHSHKVIVPTGYMGSGSSAITDLLDGVEGFNVRHSSFEFVFLHCPNGVFDLEDKLLIGNNALRSDEALHNFYKTMRQLYDKKYWWVGHYNQHIGPGFWEETQKYVESLTEFKPDFYWYYQENAELKMVPLLVANKILQILTGKKRLKKPLAYSPMWLSVPTPEKFYTLTRQYLYRIFDLLGKDKEHIVLDQLLLPFNLFRLPQYFKDDVHVFVVDRDPRDIFLSNKYYWDKNNGIVPYPVDVYEFCKFYKRLREMEQPIEHTQIHRIHFEDLIYHHEETVGEVFRILDVDPMQAKTDATRFSPEKSIYNTQLFLKKEEFQKECQVIDEQLGQYLYAFPYPVNHGAQSVF